MKEIYNEYIACINNHFRENKASGLQVMDILLGSSLSYHGRCVYTLQIPKIFTKDDIRRFKRIVNTAYGIFEKIINEYLNNPEYRNVFPFYGELKELILTGRGYDCALPIARFDIFYNEETGDFKFCEINTDGTSAMNEDYVLGDVIGRNFSHSQVSQKHRLERWELYDSWVNEFANIYFNYDRKVENPRIAIVDFLEEGSVTEFEEFRRRFEKAGFECEVCEITKLNYDGSRLYSASGKAIDAIYRRAVTADIMKRADEVRGFIRAVKDRNVCIIGAFCTQIIHNKWLFKTLWESETLKLLSESEKEFVKKHVPYTNLLSPGFCDLKKIIDEKDRWLIKPLDSYASKGVFAGCELKREIWARKVKEYFGKGYVFQEYCPPYKTDNIDFVSSNPEIKKYANMSGLFVYNGKFSGVYSRLSDGAIISSQYNEKAVPSFKLMD